MHFIANQWVEAQGKSFESLNPATQEVIWTGNSATAVEVDQAVLAARMASFEWANLSLEERIQYLSVFNEILKQNRVELQGIISQETGKPLWEADTEMGAMIAKLALSIEAYQERCRTRVQMAEGMQSITRHKPHGVVAVLGPFNFPAHLPNGHIIPALLAGNTVVFKPSELTPLVAQKTLEYWQQAKLPLGVINMIQGTGETGALLVQHPRLDGLMFTGSFKTGLSLSKAYAAFPHKILALEMGGNNPLVIHRPKDISAAVYYTILSAFISAGQRCTCARRLILTKSRENEALVAALEKAILQCTRGPYTDTPEPFIGPLISKEAATQVMHAYEYRVKLGAKVLVPMVRTHADSAFLSPGLIDISSVREQVADEEIFGPLLQLIWVDNFEEAIREANRTQYGLVAGLFCEDANLYQQFYQRVRAGVINWNRPLIGSSSHMPFGGIGRSGNHRPSAYYAADYCAYPVAGSEQSDLTIPEALTPGIPVR